ncbi:hypothetical protein CJD36_004140 [Flavipsychrobacter stenotrophus]|uniref:Uncharacterized protein n=1 Tax=Flavipsychrobacter stenotrophus TaxID=2077091 RepID=A0A2S7T234_9BACT|nr:hypothetical protein [Flavipsychrobacter stenotrophus]PQJ12941.1 hypothetical protein CJD36_004140 [Flavipsychrobacter stenotrophus]
MAKQEITYYWGDNHLLINLGSRINTRMRVLYVFELLFTLGLASLIIFKSFPIHHHYFLWINITGASLLYFLAVRRFLLRMFLKESIVLDDQYIAFEKQTIFSKKVRRYDWRLLGPLHYEGHAKKTDHPLKGKTFDYFGFETQEQIIQVLHRNGNLYFETHDGRLYFALGVYSWHAEEMVQMMKMYMGNYLRLGPEWEEMLQTHEMDDVQ